MLPLRLTAGAGASWADLARGAGEAATAVLAHNALPLDQVLEAARVERTPGACPLFQVREGAPAAACRAACSLAFILSQGVLHAS